MEKFRISALNVFPVKSLAGIEVKNATAGEKGFQYDHRWMVADENNKFLTQREYPKMCLLGVDLVDGGLEIFDKKNPVDKVVVDFFGETEPVNVVVWDDHCLAERYVAAQVSDWLSAKIGRKVFLVFSPDSMSRKVDARFSPLDQDTGFSDGFPYLLTNSASLADLNERAGTSLDMIRFRPNIVVEGVLPYQEDSWRKVKIGDVIFHLVKPCARCVIPTIDPDTGTKAAEPLKTLSTYRRLDNKVLFGQNMVAENTGEIKVGDWLEVLEVKP